MFLYSPYKNKCSYTVLIKLLNLILKMNLISDSVLPAGHSRQCFPNFSGRSCLIEMPESVWVHFPLIWFPDLCQLEYLQY